MKIAYNGLVCKPDAVFGDLDERQLLSLAAYYEHLTPRPDGVMAPKRERRGHAEAVSKRERSIRTTGGSWAATS